ncbi:hypothetical protein, partial [Methanocorpusculum vombati]
RPKENTPKYANTNESRSIVWNVVLQSEPQKPATTHRTPEKPQTASAHRKSQNTDQAVQRKPYNQSSPAKTYKKHENAIHAKTPYFTTTNNSEEERRGVQR